MWFQYPEKLNKDSFRIFTLEPGEEKNDLHGSLQTHCLDAAPAYEALSYEWGDQTETISMKCNNYKFKITKSLDVALRRLRLTNKPRSLWIDQVYINQDSYDERSAQVSIMRLIYSNAAMVVACLGPADTEAAKSVKSLLAAFTNLKEFSCNVHHFPDDDHLARLNLPRRDSGVWKDLDLILGVSYFSRVWIIQELAVSSKFQLIWGDITVSEDEYESLKDKILFLSTTEADREQGCPKITWKSVPLSFLGKKKWDDEDLLKLVQSASESKATNQRDMIYALIGLAGQRHYNVEPDYSKPESEVFADFATRVISTNENLAILNLSYVEDPNDPKRYPLWAPRWQPEDNTVAFLQHKFKASKDIEVTTKPSRATNIIELSGLEVGVVEDMHHREDVQYGEDAHHRGPTLHRDVATALEIVKNHNTSFQKTYELDAIKVVILTMMAGRETHVFWAANLRPPEDESYLDNFITYAAIEMLQTMLSTGYDTELFDLIQLALQVRGPVPQDEPHIGYTSEEQSIFDRIRMRYPDNPEYISTAHDLIMLLKPVEKVQDGWRFMKSIAISKGLNFFIREMVTLVLALVA